MGSFLGVVEGALVLACSCRRALDCLSEMAAWHTFAQHVIIVFRITMTLLLQVLLVHRKLSRHIRSQIKVVLPCPTGCLQSALSILLVLNARIVTLRIPSTRSV